MPPLCSPSSWSQSLSENQVHQQLQHVSVQSMAIMADVRVRTCACFGRGRNNCFASECRCVWRAMHICFSSCRAQTLHNEIRLIICVWLKEQLLSVVRAQELRHIFVYVHEQTCVCTSTYVCVHAHANAHAHDHVGNGMCHHAGGPGEAACGNRVLANISWSNVGQFQPSPTSGRHRPRMAEIGPSLGSRSDSTNVGEPFGNFWANSKLAGIAGGNVSGGAASNHSATFWYTNSLRHERTQ